MAPWGLCLVLLVSLLFGLLSLGCATRSLHVRDWYETTTEHFRIVSALGYEETRALARDLEGFRVALEFALGDSPQAAALRTRVYAFDGRSLTRPFSIRGEPGYFLSTLRGGTIVLRRGEGWSGDATLRLRHLYAHFVQRNRDGTDRPLWYDEGIAQFASTLRVSGQSARSGLLRNDHVASLRGRLGVSIDDLLSLRTHLGMSRGDLRRFEADSWALVHFLIGELGGGDPAWLRHRMRRYEALVARREPTTVAFRRAFGRSSEEVDAKLLAYVRSERFVAAPLRLPQPNPNTTGSSEAVRALSLADARAALGWLAVDLGRANTSRRFFELALELKPGHAGATAGMGAADRLDGRWDAAESHFERALHAAPDDPALLLEAGRYQYERARVTDGDERSGRIAHARELYASSLALDASQPATHALLGASHLLDAQGASEGIPSLRRALELMPSSLEAMLLLARLEAKRGDTGAAYALAESVLAHTHSDEQALEATQLIDEYRSDGAAGRERRIGDR